MRASTSPHVNARSASGNSATTGSDRNTNHYEGKRSMQQLTRHTYAADVSDVSPCPSWCTDKHLGILPTDADGNRFIEHVGPAGVTRALVDFDRTQRVTFIPDGIRTTSTYNVVFDSDIMALTADGARELARAMLDAADVLDAASGRTLRRRADVTAELHDLEG